MTIRVIDLRPGDMIEGHTFIAQTAHPIWPHLQLVVWRLAGAGFSLDALSPAQEVGELGLRGGIKEVRAALLDGKGTVVDRVGAEPVKGWRVVITDSESASGVAPVCPQAMVPRGAHDLDVGDLGDAPRFDEYGVYDCCPQPHIECANVNYARAIATLLSQTGAELCS